MVALFFAEYVWDTDDIPNMWKLCSFFFVTLIFLLAHCPLAESHGQTERVQYCCLSYSWWASELQDSHPKTDWCKAEPLCRKAELGWWNAAFKNQQPFSALCHHGGTQIYLQRGKFASALKIVSCTLPNKGLSMVFHCHNIL